MGQKITALEKEIADYNRAFDAAVRENDEEMMKTHCDLITVAYSNLTKLQAEKQSRDKSGLAKAKRGIILPVFLEFTSNRVVYHGYPTLSFLFFDANFRFLCSTILGRRNCCEITKYECDLL